MHVVRSAIAGLLLGAAVGFVLALLRPRQRSPYAAGSARS
jgi:gas vesicle protein